jgi:cobalt-zinc-cadmium efflux system membrane fusion protein
MSVPRSKIFWYVVTGIVVLVVAAGTYLAVHGMPQLFGQGKAEEITSPPPLPEVELVKDKPYTLSVPQQVQEALGIQKILQARVPEQGQTLVLPGTTALDPARMWRIRTRFNAEITKIGKIQECSKGPDGRFESEREIRAGDPVKGPGLDPSGKEEEPTLLAEVWSVEVGSKKSDLADAIVQLRLDEQRLKSRLELWKNGSIPEDALNQTRRDLVADLNNVDRAERTLKIWRVPEAEIKEVKDEAEKAFQRGGRRDKSKEELWARSAILAPMSGTIVERNIGLGEYVADNNVNLFVIADVNRLMVMANPAEDYLQDLLKIPRDKWRWNLHIAGFPPREDEKYVEIGPILDSNQHTVVVKGYLNNPKGELRAGQFVSASIQLDPLPDRVEVPLTALVEDGKLSFVFVQPDPEKNEFTLRRVLVTHRFDRAAWVKTRLTDKEREQTPEEAARGVPRVQPLQVGDRYLPTGVLELRAALVDRMSREK